MAHYTSLRDIATDLAVCAEETGYDYDFLAEVVEDEVKDGATYDEAVQDTLNAAYERDF